MLGQAREGRPFLMNVQSNEVTAERMRKYRETMLASGHDEAAVGRNVSRTWVWRNIFVAETDAEAERIAVPRFQEQLAHRKQMRERIYRVEADRLRRVLGDWLAWFDARVLHADHPTRLIILTGFMGAFTTFSSFSLEGLQLFQAGRVHAGLAYVVGSNLLGLTAVFLGSWLGRLAHN